MIQEVKQESSFSASSVVLVRQIHKLLCFHDFSVLFDFSLILMLSVHMCIILSDLFAPFFLSSFFSCFSFSCTLLLVHLTQFLFSFFLLLKYFHIKCGSFNVNQLFVLSFHDLFRCCICQCCIYSLMWVLEDTSVPLESFHYHFFQISYNVDVNFCVCPVKNDF